MSNTEHMTNCITRAVLTLEDVERNLDGAGEHIYIADSLEDSEMNSVSPHDGQGDFAEFLVNQNDAMKDLESLKMRRYNELALLGVRLAAIATLHPLEYAKVLIQLGHEPMPIQVSKNIFGHSVRTWPNLFKYIGHIRSVDGFYGCYRGLAPRLLGFMVSFVGGKELVDRVGLLNSKDEDLNNDCFEEFVITLKRDVALTASGLILSHPFHVISLRMMAQFVGHETTYKTVFGSFLEIYRNDGLGGFFAGLVPKLLCDVSCVALTSSVTYLINKYYVKDKLIRQYNGGLVQYIFASMLYPLQVISSCMAVSHSGLLASKPPKMAEYKNWIDCWMDLESRGEHKRGASLFWRSVPSSQRREYVFKEILDISSKDPQA